MKLLSILAITCATLSNAQLIKISGKWYDKVTVTSDDGTSTRTVFSAVDHPENSVQLKPLPQLPPLRSAITVIPTASAAIQKLTQKSKIQAILSHFKNDDRKKNEESLSGDDINNDNQDDQDQLQQSLKVAPQLYPSPFQSNGNTKPEGSRLKQSPSLSSSPMSTKLSPVLSLSSSLSPLSSISVLPSQPLIVSEPIAIVSKVLTDRLDDDKPKLAQAPIISTTMPSLRRISSPFGQVDSPFSRQASTSTIDINNNLSTHDTNRIDGKNNVIDGRYNDVVGNINVINKGNYNQIRGDRNIIHFGDNNVIKGDGSFVAGSGNIIY